MFPIDQYVLSEDKYRRQRARESWRAVNGNRRHHRKGRDAGRRR